MAPGMSKKCYQCYTYVLLDTKVCSIWEARLEDVGSRVWAQKTND